MISQKTKGRDIIFAQSVLLLAIFLQVSLDKSLVVGPKYMIAVLEILLVFGIGFTTRSLKGQFNRLRRGFSIVLIALISIANTSSMFLVARDLINGTSISGKLLLASAGAIFITNIIIFSLWYWELDSPGLTGMRRHDSRPKFDFPQMESKIAEAQNWEPAYGDYLYVSVTNATAFSPTDTMPLSGGIKLLMGLQSFISLLTVVLVTARAVNILG